jgi:hypothetical protein
MSFNCTSLAEGANLCLRRLPAPRRRSCSPAGHIAAMIFSVSSYSPSKNGRTENAVLVITSTEWAPLRNPIETRAPGGPSRHVMGTVIGVLVSPPLRVTVNVTRSSSETLLEALMLTTGGSSAMAIVRGEPLTV